MASKAASGSWAEGTTSSTSAIRRLALARGITYSGGNAAFWALSAILYQQTHSATLVAAVALASFSVPAALSPFAGLLSDRFDRRIVMVTSEIAGALCFIAMALAAGPVALLALRVFASIAAAPFAPATLAALPSIVDDESELERANGALSKAGTAGALVGPAAAGVLLVTVGGPWIFILNAFTFLISAVLLLSINGSFCPKTATDQHSLAAGFSFLRRDPVLRPLSLAYGLTFIGVGVSFPAEVVLATSFGAGSLGYAAMICLWGFGALAGAAVVEQLPDRSRQVGILAGAATILTLGFFTVSIAPFFGMALFGMAVGGVGEGLWEVAQNCLIQRSTPDNTRGRVIAGSEAVMQAGIAVGLLCSGLVTAATGATGAFAVAGACSAVATIILLRSSLAEAAPHPRSSRSQARSRVKKRERVPDRVSTSVVESRRPAAASRPMSEDLALTP